MPAPDYNEKFARIAPQTSFRFLHSDEQESVRSFAKAYVFTQQELHQVCDMALDRIRWKESGITEAIRQTEQSLGRGLQKKSLLRTLRQLHQELRAGERNYQQFDTADKPKTIKPLLKTTVKPKLGLGRCPVASEKTRCCNLLTLDAVEKCGFDCSYCSIQSFYHGNEVEFDSGFADKLDALELDPEKTYHIGTGQSSDSLMWGNHGGILDALARFAERYPNVILELKTKSRNISWLLENEFPKNIVSTWSLNPQIIIDNEEHLSASLDQRITSARRVADKGRLVGFHFHPILMYQGWEQEYQDICHRITREFDAAEVALISMGTLTFTKSVMKTIRQRPFKSKILQMPMEEIAGKFSYPLDDKIKMFRTVYQGLDRWKDSVFFYLCMEAQSLWQPVFGFEYDDNIALETAMKSAYFNKIRQLDS